MLTREDVLEAVTSGNRKHNRIDGRDFTRLVDFFPVSDWPTFGIELKEGTAAPESPLDWTEDTIKAQLRVDLKFAFEKALNRRGISASLMKGVVQMWAWILEANDIAESDDYAQYGLPILKATAERFDLPNPIGTDRGDEPKYSEDAEY